jgi:plastocyanin
MTYRKKGSKIAMTLVPAAALIFITFIAAAGAVEITTLVVAPQTTITTVQPGLNLNSTQPTSPIVAQVAILLNSGINENSPGLSPNAIIVIIGMNNTVTWTNEDLSPHMIASDSPTFNSGNLTAGQSFTYTFSTVGTFNYQCPNHPWIHGMVTVKNLFAA